MFNPCCPREASAAAAVLPAGPYSHCSGWISMGPDSAALETTNITVQCDGPAGVVRRLPVGAEPQPEGGVHFRVWAPRCTWVAVEIEGAPPTPLREEAGGCYAGLIAEARPGMRYGFRTDMLEDKLLPDPVSRFQPEGP